MVDTYTVVLQSPSFDGTDGSGEQIPMPVVQGSEAGQGLADVLSLFGGDNLALDFGKLKEAFTLQGFFTTNNMNGEKWRYDSSAGAWENYQDAVHAKDILRRTRKIWSSEAASGNWGSTGLPSEERDSGTSRKKGRVRLIFDKTYLTDHASGAIDARGTTPDLDFLFVYGFVTNYQIGPRAAASHRDRIPFTVTFVPATTVITT